MRINARDERAANIKVVLLDGKQVPMCWEADDEEGWVVSLVPDVPNDPAVTMSETEYTEVDTASDVVEDETELLNLEGVNYKKITRTGVVEIKFHSDDTSLDN